MARFVFQLEGVLRQRKLVEQDRQRDLAAVLGQLTALQNELKALDASVQATSGDVRANHLTGPLDMSFLAAHRRYLLATQRKAMTLVQQMAEVQKHVDAARGRLAEAAKQRKIIEKLRERQHERWLAEQNRKEMLAADEAATQFAFFAHDGRDAAAATSASDGDAFATDSAESAA